MERLILTDVDMPAGLRQFLTANEVPPALADWRSALSQTDNIGLALRWVAALEEMEPFLEIPEVVRDAAMVAWHDGVKELLGQYTNTLEHMENLDCLTIISVRLRRKKAQILKSTNTHTHKHTHTHTHTHTNKHTHTLTSVPGRLRRWKAQSSKGPS
jgi:hypothetical protein